MAIGKLHRTATQKRGVLYKYCCLVCRTGDRECPMYHSGNVALDVQRRSREDPMSTFVQTTNDPERQEKLQRVAYLKQLLEEIREEERERKRKKMEKRDRKESKKSHHKDKKMKRDKRERKEKKAKKSERESKHKSSRK